MKESTGHQSSCGDIAFSSPAGAGEAHDKGARAETTRVSITAVAQSYTGQLRAYFGRHCRNRADVDDLVQQVMLRILACEATDDVRHIGAYVYKTAAHVLADQHRRGKARAADAHVEFDAERHGDRDHDPSEIVAARQALAIVGEALAQLPERSRVIFLQRRLDNRPYRDIAAQFCISVSAVEKHMIRSASLMLQARERAFCDPG